MRPDVANQRRRMTPLGQEHLPAHVEIGLRAEPPHRLRHRDREITLIADLEQPDFTHRTLPSPPCSVSWWDRLNSSKQQRYMTADRVLFPESGFTKSDAVAYYKA